MGPLEPQAASTTTRTRAPRVPAAQRRDEIMRTAARLFQQWGYGGVGIDDIGSEIGISGPAIYRHFPGKEALLAEIGLQFLDSMVAVSEAAIADTNSDTPTLSRLVTAAVDLTLDRPAELAVCLRSLWYLNEDRLAEVDKRWQALIHAWTPVIAEVRPDLDASESSIYVRASCGLIVGASRAKHKVPHARLVELVSTMVMQVVDVRLAPVDPAELGDPPAVGGWERSSRREKILGTAITMFRERGFRGVSMADIAEAIGVTAGASYRHFESKEDILATAIHRASERVVLGLSDALAPATSAEDALDRLLQSYVNICVENSDLIAVSLSEMHHVPEAMAKRQERVRLFNEEWTHCLAVTRSELSHPEATALVTAITGLVTESVRSRRVGRRPRLSDDLYRLAHAVLAEPGADTHPTAII
ncbi:TetR/AcrR family transcriptional regulator [Rhodococcus sp. ACPA1]|uniref:TetR/AcrR family transcriptional regulator n=1 Tax=Rhodococcus sp. ACPA1 TaxID=2028572 RepID=UPI000BB14677|nr:TetR/AcrR family transcriptional regulator [Rhodococcus sp. ACPA1]PBC54998.1 hypothetical protein CJ177_18515 [Rhodococcus sp. ACPA1]